jgi:hypothetical protein
MKTSLKLLRLVLLIFFFNSTHAALPSPIYIAYFMGDCATSVGKPDNTAAGTCASMVNKLAANCPSDTSGATYTPAGAALRWDGAYSCMLTITVPEKLGVPASTGKATLGIVYAKYICKDLEKTPTTFDEWRGVTEKDKNVECPVPCPVEPLKPITDPDALRFENGDNVRTDRLSANIQRNLQCLRNAIALERPAGSITVTSAWRPQAYQDHLREIVDKISQINTEGNKKIPACDPIRSDLLLEKARHGLGTIVGRTSNHTAGNAFDASWSGIRAARLDALATQCGLTRPFPTDDPVHFQ